VAIYSFLAVFGGAGFGACLRWWLGARLNPLYPSLPIGTLAANLLGGYLIGIAVDYFSQRGGLPPQMRLFVVTGFLGGLTTFSTFSSEVVSLLERGLFGWAAAVAVAHLGGSLALASLGLFTARWALPAG
jgi:CrcB protein